jgi:hypothetical protein
MGLILRKTLDFALQPVTEVLPEPFGAKEVFGDLELAEVLKDDTLAVMFYREPFLKTGSAVPSRLLHGA